MASLHALQSASCSRRCLGVAAPARRSAQRLRCRAGFGFLEDEPVSHAPELYIPKSAYGLNISQMAAMGITGDDVQRYQTGMTEVHHPCQLPRSPGAPSATCAPIGPASRAVALARPAPLRCAAGCAGECAARRESG